MGCSPGGEFPRIEGIERPMFIGFGIYIYIYIYIYGIMRPATQLHARADMRFSQASYILREKLMG